MKLLTIVFLLAVLSGCASVPPPAPIRESFPEAVQNKAMVAQHWGAIAADVAAQTKRNQASKDFLQERPLYVAPASTNSPFDQAFTNFMITALVEAGLPVAMQPEGAVEIRYETQLIRHNLEFDPRMQGYVPGAPTSVGANFWVLRNATQPLPDALESDPDKADPLSRMRPSSAEMLITTSIVDNEQFIQRTTDAYYIEKVDADLFEVRPVEAVKPRVYREWSVESK